MARPRKDRRLDASPDVVRAALRSALEVDGRIREARDAINRINVRIATQGVHPGVLAFCRRIAKMKPAARAEAIDYGFVVVDSALEALHRIHSEALAPNAVRLVGGQVVFSDPADQEFCAGSWRVTKFRRNGTASSEIEIAPPEPAAAEDGRAVRCQIGASRRRPPGRHQRPAPAYRPSCAASAPPVRLLPRPANERCVVLLGGMRRRRLADHADRRWRGLGGQRTLCQ